MSTLFSLCTEESALIKSGKEEKHTLQLLNNRNHTLQLMNRLKERHAVAEQKKSTPCSS
jgi:hypothetical protein